MRARLSKRGFLAAPGRSIALALLLCAWTSEAEAGCSRHLVEATHPARISHRLDALVRGDAADVSDEAPVRPPPCSRALCSGKPALPIPPPIATARPAEAVAPRPSAPPALPAAGRRLAHKERIVRGVVEGPSIERPPR